MLKKKKYIILLIIAGIMIFRKIPIKSGISIEEANRKMNMDNVNINKYTYNFDDK